jgi:mono/diheme cytochrome c family protein
MQMRIPVRGLLSLTLLVLAGCKPLPPSKPMAELTPQELRGAQLFAAQCARCHEPNTTHRLKGPGLQAITKIPPFNTAEGDGRIRDLIAHGRFSMPATPLNEEQFRNLLAYLHTL